MLAGAETLATVDRWDVDTRPPATSTIRTAPHPFYSVETL
jgi:hypothetical protein